MINTYETEGEPHWIITHIRDDIYALEAPTSSYDYNDDTKEYEYTGDGVEKVFEGSMADCISWLVALFKIDGTIQEES